MGDLIGNIGKSGRVQRYISAVVLFMLSIGLVLWHSVNDLNVAWLPWLLFFVYWGSSLNFLQAREKT